MCPKNYARTFEMYLYFLQKIWKQFVIDCRVYPMRVQKFWDILTLYMKTINSSVEFKGKTNCKELCLVELSASDRFYDLIRFLYFYFFNDSILIWVKSLKFRWFFCWCRRTNQTCKPKVFWYFQGDQKRTWEGKG